MVTSRSRPVYAIPHRLAVVVVVFVEVDVVDSEVVEMV